ncbi:MAG: InlB B-repeat-containing protein [Bacilli bacterium]|jgi:uncharacterized repeat protein (TIGR02543 family)|nr:InlB B-repeat-containing protein [Bacilli bacterium]
MKKGFFIIILTAMIGLLGACEKKVEPTLQFETTTITIELMETFTLTPITNQNADQVHYVIGDATLLTQEGSIFQGIASGEVMIVASLTNYPQIKRYILVQIISYAEEYSIIYDLNGGALPINQVPVVYSNYTLPVSLPLPIKDGFEFGGWYLEEDFSTASYLILPAKTTGDIILYAKWE